MAVSKVDRLSDIESLTTDADLSEFLGYATEFAEAVEEANEAIEAVRDQAAEAQGYHEERDWDSRNSAIEELDGQIEQLSDALDRAEEAFAVIPLVMGQRFDEARATVEKVRKHTGVLL